MTNGEVFLGVHHVGTCGGLAVTNGRSIADLDALLDPALGGDQNDPIGTTRAVDARSGRVFQHLDVFDVVGVEAGQRVAVHGAAVATREVILGDGDAVDDIQGITASGDGTQAADPNNGSTAGHAGTLRYLDTRRLPLEGGLKGGRLHRSDFLRINGRDGPCNFFLALDAVSHDHRFIQQYRVFAQSNVQGFGFPSLDVDSLDGVEVTDEREGQGLFARGHDQRVLPVQIGEDALAGCGHHGGRRQSIALVVRHASLHGGLAHGDFTRPPKEEQRSQGCNSNHESVDRRSGLQILIVSNVH